MSLNLIADPWIPVLCRDGSRKVIAPWQMAEPSVLRPDWPRADLNLGCLEFLIGLVYLADPPADIEDWDDRRPGDPERLREVLAPYAPAFELLGDGPRFLQNLEPLDGATKPLDYLFIDCASENAREKNFDVSVHRDRYLALDLPLAAMTLYTYQTYLPSGGPGGTSGLRGGGPLVTLADTQSDLWGLIWANVPEGTPSSSEDLPWMRPTQLSREKQETLPPDGLRFGVEGFFGMPRRLRLLEKSGLIIGYIEKKPGQKYQLWVHPLSPHRRKEKDQPWSAVATPPGHFGYTNWIGITARLASDERTDLALCIRSGRKRGAQAAIVAGWAMDKGKPRDFVWSEQPLLDLAPEAEDRLIGMIKAGEAAGSALSAALAPSKKGAGTSINRVVLAEGAAREAECEAFFQATEPAFLRHLQALALGTDPRTDWLEQLRRQALDQFGALAFSGLDRRPTREIEAIVAAHRNLQFSFLGYGKFGGDMFDALGLDRPARKKGKAA